MKIIRSVFAFLLSLLTVLSVLNVSASPYGRNLGAIPRVENNIIEIDGIMDEEFKKGLKVKTICQEDDDIYSYCYLLWEDNYLLLYADVYDYELMTDEEVAKEETPWYIDSLELFVDEKNDGFTTPTQYRVNVCGERSCLFKEIPDSQKKILEDNFFHAGKKTDYGFTVEMKVTCNATVNQEIGIMLMQNAIPKHSWLEVMPEGTAWTVAAYPYAMLGDFDDAYYNEDTFNNDDKPIINENDSDSDNDKGKNTNPLLYIIAGEIILLLAVIFFIVFIIKGKKNKNK